MGGKVWWKIAIVSISICLSLAEEFGVGETGASKDTAVLSLSSEGNNGKSFRRSRLYRGRKDDESRYENDQDDPRDDDSDMKAMSEAKVDYWGGYYDFLINEGSYKFWAVFQLSTAALLIYSGFAALYYAKVNPPSSEDELDDIFRRRRKRRSLSPWPKSKPFSGLDPSLFQRLVDAVPPLPEARRH